MMDTTDEMIDEEMLDEGEDVKLIQDPGDEVMNEVPEAKSSHLLELLLRANNDGNRGDQMMTFVHMAVYEQLKNWGIDFESPTTRGRSKGRKSNGKSGKYNGANRLVEAKLTTIDFDVRVPILIKECCDFLRRHISTEGIFRKSGSSSRVQTLMQRFAILECNEEFAFSACDTVFDVATVLKQYLRELDTPLIPYEIHGLFRRCLDVSSESSREEAILLCTCLLSEMSISILTYLVEFLSEVVSNSNCNKMSYENLAIVIGPNILPVETKKNDKTKELELERKFIDAHTKIMEILIRNGPKLGCLPVDLEKKVESEFFTRGSEDELDNEGLGRRKKRRSGSLTRVLGFLRKVASNRDTPVAQTPDFADFTHTPVMKSSKRRCLDENIFSLQKKKTILDGIRKNGLVMKDDDKRFAHISDTPNSIAGFITCPSPVCLNPSPMKMDWKQTPNTARFKNLVTPSLLRRKGKHTDLAKNITPFSAPAKPVKTRLGLLKKSSKTQTPVPVLTDTNGSTRKSNIGPRDVKRLSSSVSIRKLNGSPRKSVVRASSTRIPRPDRVNPVRKSSSSCRFPIASPDLGGNLASTGKRNLPNTSSISGEYVRLSPSAHLNDVRNDAFIASKLSCLDDTADLQTGQENEGQVAGGNSSLRLTPLIQEINTLTLTAQEELTLSGLRKKRSASKISSGNIEQKQQASSVSSDKKPPPVPSRATRRRSSGASSNKARLQSPPKVKRVSSTSDRRPRSTTTTPKTPKDDARRNSIRKVEDKFVRAMNETKIMRIQSERSAQVHSKAVNLHRRFSVQDKGLSPAQRRIASNASRRKSHESNRPTMANTPATAIGTPLNDLGRYGFQPSAGSISRSPNRCTLKRGRPNTLRAGLARPSPSTSRNNSTLGNSKPPETENPSASSNATESPAAIAPEPPTTLRRMSSVQELVKQLEKTRKDNTKRSSSSLLPERDNPLKPVNRTEPPPPKRSLSRRDSSASKFVKPTPVKPRPITQKVIDVSTPKAPPKLRRETRSPSDAWVPASDFNFETQRTRFLKSVGAHSVGRDSIQALKTMNAGKVSENVRLFDGMCRTRKSPGKSLIPRYVALHRQESFNNSNNRRSASNTSKTSI